MTPPKSTTTGRPRPEGSRTAPELYPKFSDYEKVENQAFSLGLEELIAEKHKSQDKDEPK